MKRLTYRGKAWIAALIVSLLVWALAFVVASEAFGVCRTNACWDRVHQARVTNSVEKKIRRITPYRCYGSRSVIPCDIIASESRGRWWILNTWTSGVPCSTRACGFYQFLDKPVPWPVLVKSRYETLKRKLAHHRMARILWFEQNYRGACHWCS